MINAILIIYAALVTFELFLILIFQFRLKQPSPSKSLPTEVSILVCARNEELNLERSLESLLVSDYALEKVEILVGNDNSTDRTQEIIERYEARHEQIRILNISNEKDGLIAKGNVLAQLVDEAKFDKILIIDADMKVSRSWLTIMSQLLEEHDLISGLTMVDKDYYRPQIQFFDWAIVLHSMKSMADVWQPISIFGNNMGFRREAYEAVGGFRGLGPTDVEDLGLLRRFQKKGRSTFQYLGKQGKAFTKAQHGWKEMLEQRCRWMHGVFTHHWLLGVPALFARLWLIVFLVFLFINREASSYVLFYGLILNWIKYLQVVRKTQNGYKFTLYLPIIISLLDTFALLRIVLFGKVSWKGRKF